MYYIKETSCSILEQYDIKAIKNLINQGKYKFICIHLT